MNKILHVFSHISILLLFLVFNAGCVEKQGYYNHGEEGVISLICDITWASEKTTDEKGSIWQGTYNSIKTVHTPVQI